MLRNKSLINELPAPPSGKTGWPWDEEVNCEIYERAKTYPKISIITPSYNQGDYIEQTIRSVLLQNYPDLEYIIIDGGSTDESVQIIKKYSPWLKYHVSEKDKGQTNAINKGLPLCEGDIFNWVNSDDYYKKGCFKIIADEFTWNRINILSGFYEMYYEEESRSRTVDFSLSKKIEDTIAFKPLSQISTFYRTEIFKSLGELDEGLNFVMDQDIWIKYLFKYGQEKVKVISNELAVFRVHAESKTSQNDFRSEYMSIFFSIAKTAGLTGFPEVLRKIYGEEIDRGFEFKFEFSEDNIILAEKVINALIYFNARKAYTSGDMVLLEECLSILDKKLLNEEQISYLRKLKIKQKLKKYKLTPVLNLISKEKAKDKEN